MQDAILGLDIGTNSTKAILFSPDGREIALAQQGYPLHTPQPGWAEEDPDEVWQAALTVLRRIVEAAAGQWRIRALALAAQSGSLIPCRADGRAVYPMITWLDSRTEALVSQWQADGREAAIRRMSGWWLHPGLPFPSIAWLREFKPDVFAQTERFLGVLDFMNYRLTGQFCTDFSAGAEMQLVDVTAGHWSDDLTARVGITPAQLARLAPAGTGIGPITAEVSRATGLPAETPVINGGHDQCCAALGMGMTEPGQLMLASGTAWVINAITAIPAVESAPASMDLSYHVAPRRWTISQLLGGFGATVEWWLRENLQATAPDAPIDRPALFARFDELIRRSQPGSNGLLFLPLGGGAQVAGSRPGGGFIGLRLDHTRADMAPAVLEGVAFEVRWALDTVRQAGLPAAEVGLSGGASQSPVWPQILADVTGLPFTLTDYGHWPALGAAVLAGTGAGLFGTLAEGITRLQPPGRQVIPAETHRAVYQERFAAYQRYSRLLVQV
jgi:xylulokinase